MKSSLSPSPKQSSGQPSPELLEDLALRNYFAGRDTQYAQDYSDQIAANAVDLLSRVASLLAELNIQTVRISSGWRPYSVNNKTPGASPYSWHISGKAVDLLDREGTIYGQIAARPELLAKYDLWMEDRKSAPTWTHLDTGKRISRPVRIFQK